MKLRVALYCLLGGLPMCIAALGAGHFAWWWLSGTVLAASFVPVALFGPAKPLAQFSVVVPVLLIVTSVCTWTEALLFVPQFREHAARDFFGSTAIYVIFGGVIAVLAWSLKLSRLSNTSVPHRAPAAAALRILLCGLAYALYYLIFGAITYQFFTKGYYPEATQAVERLGLWFWALQIGRGLLMTLSVVPIIYTLRMKRWHAALALGILFWVAGGAAPLLVPDAFMGATQRLIHIVEILTQNASLGFTAVILLRPRSAPVGAPASV